MVEVPEFPLYLLARNRPPQLRVIVIVARGATTLHTADLSSDARPCLLESATFRQRQEQGCHGQYQAQSKGDVDPMLPKVQCESPAPWPNRRP